MPFEFVDISPASLNLDLDLVEGLLKSSAGRHAGVLYAHTYGDPATPIEFLRWTKERWPDLVIIDDRCLCIPDLEPPESPVDATLYSTGYGKIVDVGFGGFAFLKDELKHQHHGLAFDPEAPQELESAYKECIKQGYRFEYRDTNWLQTDAALPVWKDYVERIRQLLPVTLAHRREINAVYNLLIPSNVQLKPAFQLWRFNLRLAHRNGVLKQIFEAGLFASSHYRSLVGIMGGGSGTHASDLDMDVVNLFNDHHYTVEMAERTARIIVGSL